MSLTQLVPPDLQVVASCGCRRALESTDEVRCDAHAVHGGLTSDMVPVITTDDEEDAVSNYIEANELEDVACREPGCVYRNDDGDGYDGYCGDHADVHFPSDIMED